MSKQTVLLKRLFVSLTILTLIALAVGCFLTIRTIGRIDQIEKASEDLNARNLRFSPRFRAQIYRLQSISLRAQVSGNSSSIDRFETLEKDFLQFMSTQEEIFDQADEKADYLNLNSKLKAYLRELRPEISDGLNERDSLDLIAKQVGAMNESLVRLGDNLASLELRWLLEKTFTQLLMIQPQGRPKDLTLLNGHFAELRQTLSETQNEFSAEPRKANALKNFSNKLTRFEIDAREKATRWIEQSSSPNQFQNFETRQEMRDELIELAQTLGDSRRQSFHQSITSYKALVKSLQYFIFIALGMLLISLFIIGWLARMAFLKPIEISLAQAEESVSTNENLATLGTLASGVAHEIRNPITTIKARLFALGELARQDESMIRQVDAIQSETNRMEHIVQDFLRFARPSDPHLEKTNLSDFLDDVHATLIPEMQSRNCAFIMGRTIEAHARIDSEQLKQVFLNLIRNAAEACSADGGEVILGSERSGDSIHLTVTDNGSGIPEEYLNQIFDPFFSKKKGGTGLGLAICRNIVEAHHGTLTCDSTEGQGTTFTISLDAA